MRKTFIIVLLMIMSMILENISVFAESGNYSSFDLTLYEVGLALEQAQSDDEFKQLIYYYGQLSSNGIANLSYDHYDILGYKLTPDEIKLVIKGGPIITGKWVNSNIKALNKTFELFDTTTDNSIANAFQHAYWNVLMYKHLGKSYAENFAAAHENFETNPRLPKAMDLYNNEKGRDYASQISNLSKVSDDDLAILVVENLVETGELKYLISNYAFLRELILYDTHIEYLYDTGTFFAYTNVEYPHGVPNYIIIDKRTKIGPPIGIPHAFSKEGIK